jgi:hypothetical protein
MPELKQVIKGVTPNVDTISKGQPTNTTPEVQSVSNDPADYQAAGRAKAFAEAKSYSKPIDPCKMK